MDPEKAKEIIFDFLKHKGIQVNEDMIKIDHILRTRLAVDNETDRGAALILTSLIDVRLRTLLEKTFIELSKKFLSEMMDGTAPLATFSAKSKIAYALGLISKQCFDAINVLRTIRNIFAHSDQPLGFTSDAIPDKLQSLRHFAFQEGADSRTIFIESAMGVISEIDIAILNSAHAEPAEPMDWRAGLTKIRSQIRE